MSEYLYLSKRSSGRYPHIFLMMLLAVSIAGNLAIKSFFDQDEITETLTNILLILLAFLLFFLFYQAYMRKIIIQPEGITFQTPFEKNFLLWTDIQSVGAYRQFRHTTEPVPFDQIGKDHGLGSLFIYCSKLPHEKVIFQNQKDTTIVFPYNPKIIDEISQHMKLSRVVR